jgi:hypothetical protein
MAAELAHPPHGKRTFPSFPHAWGWALPRSAGLQLRLSTRVGRTGWEGRLAPSRYDSTSDPRHGKRTSDQTGLYGDARTLSQTPDFQPTRACTEIQGSLPVESSLGQACIARCVHVAARTGCWAASESQAAPTPCVRYPRGREAARRRQAWFRVRRGGDCHLRSSRSDPSPRHGLGL